jgi:hypothetical protein
MLTTSVMMSMAAGISIRSLAFSSAVTTLLYEAGNSVRHMMRIAPEPSGVRALESGKRSERPP